MNHAPPEPIELSSLEAQVLHNLRRMDQRARGEMHALSSVFADAHPARVSRPALRLVKATGGGAK